MNDSSHAADPGAADSGIERDRQVRQWAMFLHLSALAGYVVFGAGFAAPVLIWQIKKTEFPELDVHGKNAVNWLISYVIYMAVGVVLTVIFIGIPLLIIVGVLGVVFPIIAGIKANNGEAWKYPLSLSILK